jgi:3-oxoisoapionate decarboxylase
VRKHGRSPNLILEQWTPFTETVERTVELEEEWARRGVQFLRRYA